MDKITASAAKQGFGDLLARAQSHPVGIERHGKLVAAVVPVHWLEQAAPADERRLAREEQRQIELNRLLVHQRIGIDLLSRPERKRRLLKAAKAEVKRWAEQGLCSQDYIDRWREWLALPGVELVDRMCSDAQGWGKAMRQNSPFTASLG